LDENYNTYLNRAVRLTLPETYRSQVTHLQRSPKFHFDGTHLHPVPFPGYSIITPPGQQDPGNAALYDHLQQLQTRLVEQLGPQCFAPVPPETFHLTLADLIWDSNYRHACEANPDFDPKLQSCLAQIFHQSPVAVSTPTLKFQVVGMMVMTRAIAACLIPTAESFYDIILQFRRAIYQNPDLIRLGVEQQYYFTPHVTLGYFGELPPPDARTPVSDTLIHLNQQWLDRPAQEFAVHRAELHKFESMTAYHRGPDWATLEF
jgi:2'-5' RNA ligase